MAKGLVFQRPVITNDVISLSFAKGVLAESRGKEVCWATFAAEVQVQGVHSHRGKGSKRSRTCKPRKAKRSQKDCRSNCVTSGGRGNEETEPNVVEARDSGNVEQVPKVVEDVVNSEDVHRLLEGSKRSRVYKHRREKMQKNGCRSNCITGGEGNAETESHVVEATDFGIAEQILEVAKDVIHLEVYNSPRSQEYETTQYHVGQCSQTANEEIFEDADAESMNNTTKSDSEGHVIK